MKAANPISVDIQDRELTINTVRTAYGVECEIVQGIAYPPGQGLFEVVFTVELIGSM
ncbi:MAG: hypothetical protein K940chlam7_00572 [Chlamydiae bacterium]|nr:hypothetical protein [Chlamydiota bacterium]